MPFEKGHPPYYTGGAVKGHAPTSDGSPLKTWKNSPLNPDSAKYKYRFDQPLGIENRKKGSGSKSVKSKERACLEAIQAGQDRDKILERRFPIGMIRRLRALESVACDPSHKDFIHAIRMVSDILSHQRGGPESDKGQAAPTIALFHGQITAPMPGTEKEEGEPAEEGGAGSPSDEATAEGSGGD